MLTQDYLLEIGTEEIPARFMPGLLADLQEKAQKILQAQNLSFVKIETWGTGRRLALLVRDLAAQQADAQRKVKGPAVQIALDQDGNFLPPAVGFAKKQNLTVQQLTILEEAGQRYVFALSEQKGQPILTLLPRLIPELILSLNLPIAMRWGTEKQVFIRPVHWLVSMYGAQVVPFTLFGQTATDFTYGHRFLTISEDAKFTLRGCAIRLPNASAYVEALRQNFVLVEPAVRRELICQYVAEKSPQAAELKDLIEETVFLAEYPTPLTGTFDPKYLTLPAEFLSQCMQKHQKYLPIYQQNQLTASFVVVADSNTPAGQANILLGNQKVLQARLEDVRFFWAEDQKHRLVDYGQQLQNLVFQKNAGTMADKVVRLQQLCADLVSQIQTIDPQLDFQAQQPQILKTAELCKTDLVSKTVYELPELQGMVGRVLAQVEKYAEVIAQGIQEHYQPCFAGDVVPATVTGICVGLADKLDTVVVAFQNGLIPTGSKDPLALRRNAAAVIQIILEKQLRLSLVGALDLAYQIFNQGAPVQNYTKVLSFFEQRFRAYLLEKNISYDIADAVLPTALKDPLLAYLVAQKLHAWKQAAGAALAESAKFKLLIETAVRVKRLAASTENTGEVQERLLEQAEEKTAWLALQKGQQLVSELERDAEAQAEKMASLTELNQVLSDYFEKVLVMAKEDHLRQNRLAFLKQVHQLYAGWADFEKIVW